jgi:hypothetical protein
MDDHDVDAEQFDRAFVASAFRLIAENGWARLSLAEAALDAGLPLDRVRERFTSRLSVLLRFGLLADQAALAEPDRGGTVRDRLFGIIMKRIDVLQAHRDGVLALLRALPADPMATVMVQCASFVSMGWLLDAAGVDQTSGVLGILHRKGLLAVWLWTINAWRRDESADLSATMAALDQALSRAEKAAGWLPGGTTRAASSREVTGIEDAERAPFEPPASTDGPPAM